MKNEKTKTEANAPLMYIVQPDIKKTTRSMQYFFSSSSEKAEKEETAAEEPVKLEETKEEPTFALIAPLEEEVKKEEPKKAHKMFQNMTIEEKASFLVQFPKHMSQPVCEVETKQKKYRGTIIEVTREMLALITPPQTEPISIPLPLVTKISIIKI